MKIIETQRYCPDCNIILTYSNKYERNRAEKKSRPCYSCRTKRLINSPKYLQKLNEGVRKYQDKYRNSLIKRKCSEETKEKLRKNAKILRGKDHPSYGKSVYSQWLIKYGKEIADKKMNAAKEKWSKSSSGVNNPMYGKPSPQGSGNGWSGWYKGWYFRSIHELSYMINVIEKHNHKWENAEQSKYGVPYMDWEGKQRTYFADFIIDGKIMVECKPSRLHNTPSVKSKQMGAVDFCEKNGLTYKIECPNLLSKEDVKTLRENNEIVFLKKYEEKYKLL